MWRPDLRKARTQARSRPRQFWVHSGAARLKTREGRNHAQQHGVLIRKALSLDFMKTRIEDLPLVRVSTLVANGYIGRDAETALVQFGDDGV
jgi:hypothetical protein